MPTALVTGGTGLVLVARDETRLRALARILPGAVCRCLPARQAIDDGSRPRESRCGEG